MELKDYVSKLFRDGFEVYPKPFLYKMKKISENKCIIVDLTNYPNVKFTYDDNNGKN